MKISKPSIATQASVATAADSAVKKSAAPATATASVDTFERSSSVSDRLANLFGAGMPSIGGGSSPDKASCAAAQLRLGEAVGRAAAQVRSDPTAFVEADGAVKPQLGELVRHELHTAQGGLQKSGESTSPATPASSTAPASWAVLGSMADGDIEAIAFLVLMQAAKSAQEDVKAIMAQVKGINDAKSQQRERLSEMQKQAASADSKGAGEIAGDSDTSSTGETATDSPGDEGARRLELAVARGPRVAGWPPED